MENPQITKFENILFLFLVNSITTMLSMRVVTLLCVLLSSVGLSHQKYFVIETEEGGHNKMNRAQKATINQNGDEDQTANINQIQGRRNTRCPGRRNRGRGCAAGWTYFPHTCLCYKYLSARKTWAEARAHCRGLSAGGDLVSILDKATNNFMRTLTTDLSWIGATDEGSEGSWRWSDGSRWGYTNWSPDNPDNYLNKQHHATINWKGVGLWDDHHHFSFGFTCQAATLKSHNRAQKNRALNARKNRAQSAQISQNGDGDVDQSANIIQNGNSPDHVDQSANIVQDQGPPKGDVGQSANITQVQGPPKGGSSECCKSFTLSGSGAVAEELPWHFDGSYVATPKESNGAPIYAGGRANSWDLYKSSDGIWHAGTWVPEEEALAYADEDCHDIRSVSPAPCPDSVGEWKYDQNDGICGSWASADVTVNCI